MRKRQPMTNALL